MVCICSVPGKEEKMFEIYNVLLRKYLCPKIHANKITRQKDNITVHVDIVLILEGISSDPIIHTFGSICCCFVYRPGSHPRLKTVMLEEFSYLLTVISLSLSISLSLTGCALSHITR